MFAFHPAAPRHTDPERLDVAKLVHGVRVRIDRDEHTGLDRSADQRIGQIEPFGLGVDLEDRAGAKARFDDRVEI
jgi:hypothetical protein